MHASFTGAAGARWMGALLLLAAGCTREALVLLLPEEAIGSPAWISWVGGELRASDGGPIQLEANSEHEPRGLVLMAYAKRLDELMLAVGPVESGITCRPCALTRPSGIWRADISNSNSSWFQLETVPDEVLADLAPDAERCTLCPNFGSSVEVDQRSTSGARTVLLTRWADGALVLYGDGVLHQLTETTSGWSASDACVRTDAFRPSAAYRATESVIWTVDASMQVVKLELDRLDPTLGCDAATSRSSTITWAGPLVQAMSGPPSAEPSELYGMSFEPDTRDALLSIYEPGVGTRNLGRLPGPENELSMTWTAPSEVVAVNGSNRLLRVRDGVLSDEGVDVGGVELWVSLVVPRAEGGYYFGSSNSLVVVEDEDGAHRYLATNHGAAQRVDSIVPFRDGLVVGERNGVFRLHHADTGYCPPQRGFGEQSVNHLMETAHGGLLGGESILYAAAPPEDRCPR